MSDIEALKITVAQCNCLTKTPDVSHHKPWCSYRVITAQRNEIADLTARLTASETALKSVSDYNERLEHRLAAAEADAERYRFARRYAVHITRAVDGVVRDITGRLEVLDAAIDAARGGE